MKNWITEIAVGSCCGLIVPALLEVAIWRGAL